MQHNSRQTFPAPLRSFQYDLEASLVCLSCPLPYHKTIRTSNLLERAFHECRRPTKVMPHFFSERACLILVFCALGRAASGGDA
jgi:transposase-like protein